MDKPQAFLEITSSSIRLLIGYALNGAPIVLYTKEKKIPNLLNEDRSVNKDVLNAALADFHSIRDNEEKLDITISHINLVLPSSGLKVFQNEKTTNVVDQNNEINRIDLSNLTSLITKEPLPENYTIVDTIPDEFILENGERYSNPPLGKISSSLTEKAKIYALPNGVVTFYKENANLSGYRVIKSEPSCFCASSLIAINPNMPKTYILVDIGGSITSVSFVGEGSPYSNASFFIGGDDLTKYIQKEFSISKDEAINLKHRYGYDNRVKSYSLPLINGMDASNSKVKYYQKDLNELISIFMKDYFVTLDNAIASLLSAYNGHYDNVPLILIGGGSKLAGLESFFANHYQNKEIIRFSPNAIGAREPNFVSLLGLILIVSQYKGTLEDNHRGMPDVSRVNKKEKARKSKESYDDDSL